MLFAICGDLGAGKTLLLTNILYRAYLSGIPLYANYHLKKIPYTHVDSLEELFKYNTGIVGLDEFWTWLDSRCSVKGKNIIRTKLVLQSRKKLFHMFYTTQSFFQIDLRVRNVTSLFFLPYVKFKIMIEKKDGTKDIHLLTETRVYDRNYKLLKTLKSDLGESAILYDTNEIIMEDIEL